MTSGRWRTMARIGQAISDGVKRGGGHLIEERLEQMMVALVDDDDVGRRPLQPLDRLQPAEARADDDDAMAGGLPSLLMPGDNYPQ